MPAVERIYTAQERRPWWSDNLVPGGAWKRILKAAGADWEVERRPMVGVLANGKLTAPSPEHHGLVLNGKLLSVVGSRFHPVQNEEQFEFAHNLGHRLVAGSVHQDGRMVVATVEHKETVKVGTDELVPYIHVVNWQGGGSLEVHVTLLYDGATTLRLPGSVMTIRHLRNLPRSKETLAEVKSFVQAQLALRTKELQAMSKRTKATLADVHASVWPKPPAKVAKAAATWRLRLEDITWVDERIAPDDLSNYGLYLTMCEWAQWGRAFRGTGGSVAKNELLRAEEILSGQTREICEKSYDYLKGTR